MTRLLSLLLAVFCFVSIFAVNVCAGDTMTLSGKRVLCVGDSLTYGYGERTAAEPRSWAGRLQRSYGMVVTNAGINGATLSDQRALPATNRRVINDALGWHKSTSFDYVLLQGGINDATGHDKADPKHQPVDVGTVAATYRLSDFDVNTFAGGLERLFYHATANYPDARIGFIITFKAPYSGYGGDSTNAARFWEVARVICDKWNIDYLDLHDGTAPNGKRYSEDILQTTSYSTPCLVQGNDYLHLNTNGYDVITPYIAQWMTELRPYGDVPDSYTPTKATTTTTTTTRGTTTTTRGTTTTSGSSVTGSVGTTAADKAPNVVATTTGTADAGTTTNVSALTTSSPEGGAPTTQQVPDTDTDVDKPVSDNQGESSATVWVIVGAVVLLALAVVTALVIVIIKRHNQV